MLLLPPAGRRHEPAPRHVPPLRRLARAVRARVPAGWRGLVLAAVLLLTLVPGNRGLWRMVSLLRDRAFLRAELARLDARDRELQAMRRRLTGDDAMIERLARERLDLARPGETVYKFAPIP